MDQKIIAYLGRANKERLELDIDGISPPHGSVIKIQFRAGIWCWDTSDETATKVEDQSMDLTGNLVDRVAIVFQPGLMEGLLVGRYDDARVIVFSTEYPEGVAWGDELGVFQVMEWSACPEPVVP